MVRTSVNYRKKQLATLKKLSIKHTDFRLTTFVGVQYAWLLSVGFTSTKRDKMWDIFKTVINRWFSSRFILLGIEDRNEPNMAHKTTHSRCFWSSSSNRGIQSSWGGRSCFSLTSRPREAWPHAVDSRSRRRWSRRRAKGVGWRWSYLDLRVAPPGLARRQWCPTPSRTPWKKKPFSQMCNFNLNIV